MDDLTYPSNMSNNLGGLNAVNDQFVKSWQTKRADNPLFSVVGAGSLAIAEVNSGESSAGKATWAVVDDSGAGAFMEWDGATGVLGFGQDRTASSYPMQINSEGVVRLQQGLSFDHVRYDTALTNGQTLTYDNTTVTNPRSGFLVIDATVAAGGSVTVRGVALRDANDYVLLSYANADTATGNGGTGELGVGAITANASNASAGFDLEVAVSPGVDLGVWWEIRSAGTVDTTGHSVA